jgi:RNA-binding protein
MKRIGEVVRTAQGLAVVRCSDDDNPGLGAPVVDQNLDDIGRIVDVFGPVDRPYVAVSPRDSVSLPNLLGEKLYVR